MTATPVEETTIARDSADALREVVRERYARAALSVTESCCAGACDPAASVFGSVNYDDGAHGSLPVRALAASLGCGNPTALAQLMPGEVVLDLGSGGGIDVLLSARRVAPGGKAYGLDMTPEMLDLARANQAEAGVTNVEFLLGSIESVPLPDASVDVIISNCVVNLSPDKGQVFREAHRVLRPGGRLAISDVVLSRPLPPELTQVVALWTGCVAGALTEDACLTLLREAGFEDASVEPTTVMDADHLRDIVSGIDADEIPAGIDVDRAIMALDGVIRSAAIRARVPEAAVAGGSGGRA